MRFEHFHFSQRSRKKAKDKLKINKQKDVESISFQSDQKVLLTTDENQGMSSYISVIHNLPFVRTWRLFTDGGYKFKVQETDLYLKHNYSRNFTSFPYILNVYSHKQNVFEIRVQNTKYVPC